MRLSLLSALFLLSTTAEAQTSTYKTDLQQLKSILQNTASYKVQIKGEKLSQYNSLYQKLLSDSVNIMNTYDYFHNLSQLLFPLRDNHLGFYQVANYNHFKTKETIDSFIRTKEFSDYPSIQINFDSLRNELAKKSVDSIEGIYYYVKYYSIGLFKSNGNEYTGVILDSDVNLWKKGQIAIHLTEYRPNLFKAIYVHPMFKNFILHPVEKYRNQTLVNSSFFGIYAQSIYTKLPGQVDYVNLPSGSRTFELKNIQDDLQYLLIRSFQRNNTTSAKSLKFYDSIKNKLTNQNLILDLRNNQGGSKQESKKYFKLLKKYTKKGHLYILLNNETISQAEILTLKLRKLKNVTTVGQTTKGMLSYGSNFGKRFKLPGGNFEIYPTDMKGKAKFLQYEDYGITPEIFLHNNSEWVEQVNEIIRK